MAKEYKVSIKDFEAVGIKPKKGLGVTLQIGDGKVVEVTVKNVGKELVIVTANE